MHDIAAVYDVRSKPYSRFNRQFNREVLQDILKDAGIEYLYLGDALGGRPGDPCCYVDGKVSYERQARTSVFQDGLAKLRMDADIKRLAVMCAEKDPMGCHRTWSIAQNLPDMDVIHIHGDGRLERHADMMDKVAPQQLGLGF